MTETLGMVRVVPCVNQYCNAKKIAEHSNQVNKWKQILTNRKTTNNQHPKGIL